MIYISIFRHRENECDFVVCFFNKGRAQFMARASFLLLILADVVRFPSAFGPWWACHFFFLCVFVCFFRERERERERYQSTRFPGALPIPSTMQFTIQTGLSAPTAAVGDGYGSICGPLLA